MRLTLWIPCWRRLQSGDIGREKIIGRICVALIFVAPHDSRRDGADLTYDEQASQRDRSAEEDRRIVS
jgi:hypothetical protein